MKYKNLIYILAAGVGVLVLFSAFSVENTRLGSSITVPTQSTFSTSTAVTVTTSTTFVQGTTTRTYMAFSNAGPQSIWLQLRGDAPAVINQGILLTASSTYVVGVEAGNPYYGTIRAISAGTASNI